MMIKKIILCTFVFAIFACGEENESATGTNRITFNGVGTHGIFDPSLAKDPHSSRIWMSYSAVEMSAWPPYPGAPDINRRIQTRIAYSDNAGSDWKDCGITINDSDEFHVDPTPENTTNNDDLYCTWVNEVSALVYDPGDPDTNKRWKMLCHRYLWVNGFQTFQHGWIEMRTAASPIGTWSDKTKLFVGTLYDSMTNGNDVIHLDTYNDDLNNCLAFSEPGFLYANGTLYVCMLGSEGSSTTGKIILIKSVDHAATWIYCGSLLVNASDNIPGYDGYSAPAMFEKNGKYYLMVSPQIGDFYKGTLIFEISDLNSASVVRDLNNKPVVVSSVFGTAGSFNGAAGYIKEATASGIIYSQAFIGETPRFRIFKSGINL